ncbi:zeta-sarcoglycan-like [Saccoglossus kowalevskii]
MGGRGRASGSSYTPVTPNNREATVIYKIGIYGWRKRCLYLLVLLLMVTIIVNLALTIWILKVMDFSIDGMGKLRITDKGLRLEGESEFLRPLSAAEIISRKDQPLTLESARNVTLNARNGDGDVLGRLVVGAEGAVFEGAIQTPHIRAEAREELRLESTTRSLYMQAPEGIELDAEGGDFTATCRTDLRLQSKQGSIVLDTKNIEFKSLQKSSAGSTGGTYYPDVYELCTCLSGKLFIADAESGCRVSEDICN